MSAHRSNSKARLVAVLGSLTAIGPLSIDMYLPAFPDIATDLQTTVSHIMLSLSSFLVGIAVGQFIYGPVLEKYGRKKPVYIGLVLYLLASLGCVFAQHADLLIALRFVQAIGGCAGMVAARAIVRDHFEVTESARIFATLMLVVAVSPIIAPTLGGYITAHLGWHYVFLLLGIFSFLLLVAFHLLYRDTYVPDPNYSLAPSNIAKQYGSIIQHPQFITYGLTLGISYGGLTAYISGSPNLFMEYYQVSEQAYGWIFAVIAAGIIGASQVNSFLLNRYDGTTIMRHALLLQGIIGILLVIVAITGLHSIILHIALIFLFLACQGCIFPNASALSLAPFKHAAGAASGLMGGIQMAIGAGATALVSVFHLPNAIPMSMVMLVCTALASSCFFMGKRKLTSLPTNNLEKQQELEHADAM